MKTALFDFALPESLIATQPANPRDGARMLVVSEEIADKTVRDLTAFLKPGDVMVFNDTRVIPARLFGRRGEAKLELLLHKQCHFGQNGSGAEESLQSPGVARDDNCWQCFARPAKKLKPGDRIDIAEGFYATVLEKLPDGQVAVQFNCAGETFSKLLEAHGHMPLPPYIDRPDEKADRQRYQTVYAKNDGSVAAPTAGLHFTGELLAAIDAMGVKRAHVTLHVGGGTFLPVKAEDTKDHVMHSEYAVVTAETAEMVNACRRQGGRVVAVGTTSLRTLESATDAQGVLHPFAGETDIFITPGYRFKCVDMLMTNFHLPKSTLFMLVSAFSGLERMKKAYSHAIAQQYRFYSYGDACLLMPEKRAFP